MKHQIVLFVLVLALLVLVFTANDAMAQGPTGGQPKVATNFISARFTYQGQLKQTGGSAVNGTCAFQFDLYAAASGGSALATQTVNGVTVANGLFTVQLDFGADAFDGNARYLQIGVKCGSESSFTPLASRQELTAAPMAHTLRPGALIQNAATTGTTPAITGETLSTSANAIAIKGQVSSTTPGSYSAAIRGINNGTGGYGIGVHGSQAGGGWGVYGFAPSGWGVVGRADTTGAGVAAWNSTNSGTALEIYQGTIKVTGAGNDTNTAVFVHNATPGTNTCNFGGINNATWFSTTQTDNDPNAILFVTFKGGGNNVNSPLGVVYDDGSILCHPNSWLIYRLDNAALPINSNFNVMVIKR